MEIPPSVCEKAFISATIKPYEGHATSLGSVMVLLSDFGSKYLKEKDFGHLALTCKELFFSLSRRPFWLNFINFSVPSSQVPKNFSVLKLFADLYARRNNQNWRRALLTSAVSDAPVSDKLVRVHLSCSGVDSVHFWQGELTALLGLKTHPTAVQVDEMRSIVRILLERGGRGSDVLECGFKADSLNLVLGAVLVHYLVHAIGEDAQVTQAEEKKRAREGVTAEAIARVLKNVDVLFNVVGLFHGVIMDDLGKDKWTLKPAKKLPKEPKVVVQGIVLALAKMTWLQISTIFRATSKGLAKQIFRAFHLMAHVEKALAKVAGGKSARWTKDVEPGLHQLQVALQCLRGAKYPSEPEGFPQWKTQVIVPLKALSENPLFQIDPVWLNDAYNPGMAGKRLKAPKSRTLAAVLSQDGNTVETWDRILNARGTTPNQVFQNWRSLIFLAYPAERLEVYFRRRLDQLDLFKLMGVRQLLTSSFDPAVFATINKAFEENPPNAEHPRSKDGRINRVVLGSRTFQDKKGKSTSKVITRSVDKECNPELLQSHIAMLERLCAEKMVTNVPAEGTAVVLLTSELLNGLRKGEPPSIPAYSKCSLWRNEGVCLSELSPTGAPPLSKVRAGITWCEKPDGKFKSVDLDLSVTLYNKEWVQIASCSYSTLHLKDHCVVHSGDIRSAPFPQGAREALEIDIPGVKKQYPECQFIAMQVYSYSGCPYEELHDGSVFVADPATPGDGPGGQNILSAARLTGAGTQNIAAFLHFDEYGRTHLYCCDQTLNTDNRSTSGKGAATVGDICKIIYDDHITQTPKTLRGIDVALLTAASLSKRILLVCADKDDVNKPRVINIERGQLNSFQFFALAQQNALTAVATHSHVLPTDMLPDLTGQPCLLISGNMPDFNDLVQSLPTAFLVQKDRKLTAVNVGSDITKKLQREVPAVDGMVDVVTGPGALAILTGLKE